MLSAKIVAQKPGGRVSAASFLPHVAVTLLAVLTEVQARANAGEKMTAKRKMRLRI